MESVLKSHGPRESLELSKVRIGPEMTELRSMLWLGAGAPRGRRHGLLGRGHGGSRGRRRRQRLSCVSAREGRAVGRTERRQRRSDTHLPAPRETESSQRAPVRAREVTRPDTSASSARVREREERVWDALFLLLLRARRIRSTTMPALWRRSRAGKRGANRKIKRCIKYVYKYISRRQRRLRTRDQRPSVRWSLTKRGQDRVVSE